MDGELLKNHLRDCKISVSEIARRIGVPQQNLASALSSKDIKTGILEEVSKALGVSPAYFYTGEDSGTAVVGNATQSTVIGKQDGNTRALERQLDVKDQQIDRLLRLLENLNGVE